MGQNESASLGPDIVPVNLEARTLEAVAKHINGGKVKKVVVLTGAGISTAAGIPDFRSPGTGLYNNLKRLNLPYPEAVFDIDFFRKHPEPFYVLAKELYPGKFFPTVSHAFIALLAKKKLLSKLFTQNIDCLERRAGVPEDLIIEAHGSFATQRCIECKSDYPAKEMQEHVDEGHVPRCGTKKCNGLVKPDIVFFGEGLPMEFTLNTHLAREADLVLVLGTSLTVYPFAGVASMPQRETPRVLFNREQVGNMGKRPDDVLELGPCDKGVRRLARLLGWTSELDALWRSIVGDKEAERQLRTQDSWEEEIEELDEEIVEKMAEGLEHLDLKDDEKESLGEEEDSITYKKAHDDKPKADQDTVEAAAVEQAVVEKGSEDEKANDTREKAKDGAADQGESQEEKHGETKIAEKEMGNKK